MSFFSKRIFNFGAKKKDGPDGLWIKCTSCAEMLYKSDLENAHWVCNKCDYHFVLAREDRLKMMVEPNSFEEWDSELSSVDKLGFTGKDSYASKLKENVSKTGHHDAITSGKAMMGHHPVALGIMDFKFLGASMGAVVGEKITRLIERATEERMPAIVVCASGGARMYEGLFSLMQMAKTSAACARHAEAGLPYIPVLTHPTMAGVMASFATLGDLIIAEPNALIGFAGPRVIKETTQQDLPEGFQRSEFLLEHGLLDMVIHRRDLKSQLVEVLDYMMPEGPLAEPTGKTDA
jgi:acetyl-CoA carboxylase carboxyl transferase subunit beta